MSRGNRVRTWAWLHLSASLFVSGWVGFTTTSADHTAFPGEGRRDESGVERRGKAAINSFVSAPECPANPTAVKPEHGGNETALDTLAHTCT